MRGVADDLRGAGVESAGLEAERLLAHALGLDRAALAVTGDEPLAPDEARRLARAVSRRLAGEPLQHIEGTVEFRELVLLADPRAFVPRPETEQLVERVAAWARRRRVHPVGGGGGGERGVEIPGAAGRAAPVDRALDIGTGSGAIALSLVAEGIAARVVATDVSGRALAQAAENLARLPPGLAGRVELRRSGGTVWGPIAPGERFDLIVSNPPYVSDADLGELPPVVRDHEPREALAGGPGGLAVVRQIVEGAPSHLLPGGALFLEIGDGQGEAVRRLLEAGGWTEVCVTRDLAGRERFASAILPSG